MLSHQMGLPAIAIVAPVTLAAQISAPKELRLVGGNEKKKRKRSKGAGLAVDKRLEKGRQRTNGW